MPDLVECPVCLRKMKVVSPGHVATHDLTWQEFRRLHPDVVTISDSVRVARSKAGLRAVRENQGVLQSPKNVKKRLAAMKKALEANGYKKHRERFVAMNKDPGRSAQIAEWNRKRQWKDESRHKIAVAAARRCEQLRRSVSQPHRDLATAMRNDPLLSGMKIEFRVSIRSADIAIPSLMFAVEMQGCFWHGCSRCYPKPTPFQAAKIAEDLERRRWFKSRGWVVRWVWECDFRRAPSFIVNDLALHAAYLIDKKLDREDYAA